MKKLSFLLITGILILVAQLANAQNLFPITGHFGIGSYNFNRGLKASVQLGCRLIGWVVVGGNYNYIEGDIKNIIDENKVQSRGGDFVRNEFTTFIGIQSPYFAELDAEDSPCRILRGVHSFRGEIHFGYQKDGFGSRITSFIRIGYQLFPILLGLNFDYYLSNNKMLIINGWHPENEIKFSLSWTPIGFQNI